MRKSPLAFLLAGLLHTSLVFAGIFDDDEARRQINDTRKQVQTSLDTQARAQLELSSQISALNDEIARLRGQLETANYELEMTRKRQQDFYLDLDTRLRNLENRGTAAAPAGTPATAADQGSSTTTTAAAPAPTATSNTGTSAADPSLETKTYEAALALLRSNKLKEAVTGFEGFLRDYPNATLAPNAQYWLASAWSAQGNCKKAIELHHQGLARWPNSLKAPDTLLSISGCQKELGLTQDARRTLEILAAKFPNTPSGEAARQRLLKK